MRSYRGLDTFCSSLHPQPTLTQLLHYRQLGSRDLPSLNFRLPTSKQSGTPNVNKNMADHAKLMFIWQVYRQLNSLQSSLLTYLNETEEEK